jgi:hypothetical protein
MKRTITKKNSRGPGRRVSPDVLAVAEAVSLRDFAALHGISVHMVRTFISKGLPVNRYPGKFTIPRALGAKWLERFRSDRLGQIVADVLKDMRRSA